MRVALLTREYPLNVYGGVGVHAEELSKVLAVHVNVDVHAFDGSCEAGASPAGVMVYGHDHPAEFASANAAVKTLGIDLEIADRVREADIPHSHTWYANMAGHIGGMLYSIPHVISARSLELPRPWKRGQLGGGYEAFPRVERTAHGVVDGIVAVSFAMEDDILRCYPKTDPDRVRAIHNGIDPSGWNAPKTDEETAAAKEYFASYGLDPDKPTVMFVGRITWQEGVPDLLRAIVELPLEIQVVSYVRVPDTPEIAAETEAFVEDLRSRRAGVVWVSDFLSRGKIIQLLPCSTVFVTSLIYEPLGIVNPEAMIVGFPVVGTKMGGIPDYIEDGVTGTLVPIEQLDDGTETPVHPETLEADLASALEVVCVDPEKVREMGAAGRKWVEEHFSWESIALKTMDFYRDVVAGL